MAGSVMALDLSLASGLRIISPLIGTQLLQQHGFHAVCVAASTVLLACFMAASWLRQPSSTGDKGPRDHKTRGV